MDKELYDSISKIIDGFDSTDVEHSQQGSHCDIPNDLFKSLSKELGEKEQESISQSATEAAIRECKTLECRLRQAASAIGGDFKPSGETIKTLAALDDYLSKNK